MTPETLDLFRAVVDADVSAVRRALAQGADVNATDGKGRNVASHAALGDAIDAIDTPVQPRLSECRLEILQLVLEHPDLSLYSLNAPLPWAGGVTLLGLMSWLNMPTEIMFLLEYTQGLVEVNAMDEQGATPLMYAARDGSLEVVQRLLAHGARPELRDASQRSAIQYALPHPQILWLCEDAVRHERAGQSQRSSVMASSPNSSGSDSTTSPMHQNKDLFLATSIDTRFKPPSLAHFDSAELRRTFEALLRATRSGDDVALHALLFPAQLENSRTTSLINLRDSSGLSLVHHAVSQRRHFNSVLDALHRAGADVGLFSTLGFSPLHHLARTARDIVNDECGEHLETVSLYTFTIHLLRDLRAPLAATDAKGETPLHAAAEHGNSRLVLQAMLEYDSMYSGAESVRELRNERGLRPVEVCRQEFLSLFAQEPTQLDTLLRSQTSWDSTQSKGHAQIPFASGRRTAASSAGRPRSVTRFADTGRPLSRSRGLLLKGSGASIQSRSSGSSSASSNTRSYQLSRKPGTPLHIHTLPTPSPTGTSLSDLPETGQSFDVMVYTHDLLSNLSLCSSALHAYSQGDTSTYEAEYGDLPDLHTLSDAIIFTRDVGSMLLEHWMARLELARAEFERARRELEKAQSLREKVCVEVAMVPDDGSNDDHGSHRKAQEFDDQHSGVVLANMRHIAVQTEVSAVHAVHCEIMAKLEQEVSSRAERVSVYSQVEKKELQEPPTPQRITAISHLMQERRAEETKLRDVEDEVRLHRWYAESAGKGEAIGASLLLGWVRTGLLPPLEVVKEVENAEESMVRREVRRRKSVSTKGTPREHLGQTPAAGLPEDTLRNAPLVLQRTEKDISGVVTQLAQVTQSFMRAQQSVAEASALVEQFLKVNEDRMAALIGTVPQSNAPHPSSSFRQVRIPHRLSDTPSVASSAHLQLSSSSVHNVSSGSLLEDPEALRRLLTHKIEKHIECVFQQLQKAHVWLRIVREVLRGLRRRALDQ